ncbi:hypothetical protein GCK32_001772 [Trichostrongylus colubriformis]|uniref:Uncharacterized protein n=1 Tax=Trichostrongylus colubriformis TaxID=6319 RepID=A0AAN8FKZ0_TRICO
MVNRKASTEPELRLKKVMVRILWDHPLEATPADATLNAELYCQQMVRGAAIEIQPFTVMAKDLTRKESMRKRMGFAGIRDPMLMKKQKESWTKY